MTRIAWGMLALMLVGALMMLTPAPASAQQADQYTDQQGAAATQPAQPEEVTPPTTPQEPSAMEQGQMPQAQAQPPAAGEYPDVSGVQPFSPEANFMSVPGYLRWQVFCSQGMWLSYAEARRIVVAQGGQLYRAA